MKFKGTHNEWDQLEEIIVGSSINAQIPKLGIDQKLIEFPDKDIAKIKTGLFPKRIIEETEEDLLELVNALVKVGIKVKRPLVIDHSKLISTYDWETDGFYSYCPRDSVLVIGEKIIGSSPEFVGNVEK